MHRVGDFARDLTAYRLSLIYWTISENVHRRVTILPDKLDDDFRAFLKQIYPKMQELEARTANDILVLSSPKDALLAKVKEFQKKKKPNDAKGGDAKVAKISVNGGQAQLPEKVRVKD